MTTKKSGQRKQQILQALAHMLEVNPGHRITTAKLAEEVGVSEAALYRHFPSKRKMFEALIQFIEETLFSRINRIMDSEKSTEVRCDTTILLLLTFAEMNPGMSRILIGDALAGEDDALRVRVYQLFERIELQLKQILRESGVREGGELGIEINLGANLLLSVAEGRINQYVRSEFERKPTEGWSQQWSALKVGLFN